MEGDQDKLWEKTSWQGQCALVNGKLGYWHYFDTYNPPKLWSGPNTHIHGNGIVPCHIAKIVEEWFGEHDRVHGVDLVSRYPWSQSNRASVDVLGKQVWYMLLTCWCHIPQGTLRGCVEFISQWVRGLLPYVEIVSTKDPSIAEQSQNSTLMCITSTITSLKLLEPVIKK